VGAGAEGEALTGAPRVPAWLLLGLLACTLILANTAVLRSETDFEELGAFRRLWSDLARGVTTYLDREYPVSQDKAWRKVWATDPVATTRRIVVEKVAQHEIRPWEFWRVVRDEAFIRERGRPVRPDMFDDPGRGLLLAAAFQLRGGIAPFLILWLAPLLLLPVVVWTAYEAFRARVPVAGAVFLALVGLSPFVLETLSFARSSAGFYLVGLLTAVPLALYGCLGPPPTTKGLMARWGAAGLVFGLCALCRSGSLFLIPALALVLAISVARVPSPAHRRNLWRVALTAFTLVLFLAPFAALRQPEHHDVWAGVWEGLGDFDRTKGHTWSDPVAEERVQREGAAGLRTPEAMAVLRADVLDHVRDDPRWYAGILARRLFATITQSRLWPTVRSDGLWLARSTSPNEGFMDKYYTYTTTVDFLGFGAHKVELPVFVVLLPTAALLGWAAFAPRWRPYALVTLLMMAATLPLPVLISTAGAVEPQAFALAYGLGFALLVEALVQEYG
jgi:hypothetical protein